MPYFSCHNLAWRHDDRRRSVPRDLLGVLTIHGRSVVGLIYNVPRFTVLQHLDSDYSLPDIGNEYSHILYEFLINGGSDGCSLSEGYPGAGWGI
jgi:hypothetical protein